MKALLFVHIAGGGLAVLAGYAAVFAPKGKWLHRRAGMLFVFAMLAMGFGAAVVGLARDKIAWTGGVTTPYFVITALLTVRRRDQNHRWLDGALMLIPIAFGINALRGGIMVWSLPGRQLEGVPAAMMFVSATLLFIAAAGDLRVLVRGPLQGVQRLRRHLWRMSWALFAATGSFFLIASRVPAPIRWAPLRMVLAFLPLPLLFYWLWRVRRRSTRLVIKNEPQPPALTAVVAPATAPVTR